MYTSSVTWTHVESDDRLLRLNVQCYDFLSVAIYSWFPNTFAFSDKFSYLQYFIYNPLPRSRAMTMKDVRAIVVSHQGFKSDGVGAGVVPSKLEDPTTLGPSSSVVV